MDHIRARFDRISFDTLYYIYFSYIRPFSFTLRLCGVPSDSLDVRATHRLFWCVFT